MRYIYLGDRLTDAALKGRGCDPVRRSDGKCVVGRSKQLVEFDEGKHVVVLRRRLRVHDALSQGGSSARE
jgi:hypothetical protein